MKSYSRLALTLPLTLGLGLSQAACGSDSAPQTFAACQAPALLTAANPKYIWTPNAIKLTSQQLAPRVFAVYDASATKNSPAGVPLATSGGFVVGDDGVLVVESMINRQLFCQLVGLVRAQTDKPIRYLVNTSSHGDHSYGNTFLPPEVQIVQHQRTAEFIAAHFAEDVEFSKMNFGADQGLDEVRPVAAHILVRDGETWGVDLGGIRVEARYHGFAQTGGDLFVQVPSAKVVWTGNPLVAAKPAVPWLLAGHAKEVSATLAEVRASLPPDTIVIPGHDHPHGVDAFGFSIDYLNTLASEVGSAVQQGRTQQETVASVTLQPFNQGYAIWDFIHSMVNVPNTYNELKK